MRDAALRPALALMEDATVEPPATVTEAKVFAQSFQGVSPVPRTVRFCEEPLRLRLPREPFLAPPLRIGLTVLSKMRVLLTASVSLGERRSDIGQRAATIDAVQFTRLDFRHQSRAGECEPDQ